MSDNFNFDDPFDGDINFDSDFESDKKGSKLKSFAIGFLGGAKEALIGSTDAKLKTVKMALPESFNGTFQFINSSRQIYSDIKEEFKQNTADSMRDIQSLIGDSQDAIKSKLPNGLSNKIDQFSAYDFSSWDKPNYGGGETTASLEGTTDQDVNDTINATQQNSMLTLAGLRNLGVDITSTLIATGSAQNASSQIVAANVAKGNAYLKQIVDYQYKVQQRNDSMKISLLARIHVTNAKFYKFMEASNHRMIKEMKDMVKFARMPDFQKMSMTDEVKKRIRGTFFNTLRGGAGGIMGLVNDRVGKYARESGYQGLNNLTSQLSMAGGMAGGLSGKELMEMMGSMVGGSAVDALPRLLQGNMSKKVQARLIKAFPELAKTVQGKYAKLNTIGHQASYGLNNIEGLFNSLSANYTGGNFFDEGDETTYEEYVANLPPGTKPKSKFVWSSERGLKSMANKGLGVILDNTYGSAKTKYDLKGRSYADSKDQHIWTNQSDRTLNEIIPKWFSMLHLSMEKTRTGNDGLRPLTYDWKKGSFVTASQAKAGAIKDVYGSQILGSAVYNARYAASTIDEKEVLSKKAKSALELSLAKQSDGKAFSPYNLLNLEKEGVDPKIAEEIRTMTLENFGITPEQMNLFNTGKDVDRAKLMSFMPGKGAALANKALPFVKDIRNGIYDTQNNIDMLRNTGQYDALRDAGIIKKVNGREEIDDKMMWKMFGLHQSDPNFDKKLATQINGNKDDVFGGETVNRSGATINNKTTNNFGQLDETLKELNENLKGFTGKSGGGVSASDGRTNTQLDALIGIQTSHTDLLTKILEKQPTIIRRSKKEANEEQQGKKTLLDRIKGISPRNLFNKGVETLLNNEPLILGGIMGGLGAYALHDPKTAMLLTAGGLAAAGYSKLRQMNKERFANTEDLYENEGDSEPLLRSSKLKNGDYFDSATRKVLQTWSDVTSAIIDKGGNIIASVHQLAKKLYGPDGRAVVIKGFNKAKEWGMKLFKLIDPFGRASKFGNKLKDMIYQQNVYKEGERAPVLIGSKFGKGFYFKLDANDKPVEIKGWNEIDGPVYDNKGECLITQDDYDRGLKTSMGLSINKLGSLTKSAGIMGLDILGKLKDKTIAGAGTAFNKTKEFVKADYTPIVSSIDRIYYLLCNKFGVKPQDLTDEEKLTAVVNQDVADHPKDETRLNSLADEKRQAKEKKDEKVQDAIINIGDSLGGLASNNGKDKKEKKTGLLGLLFSGVGMVKGLAEKFFGKTIVNGFGTLFKFASMGLGIIPKIASGIGNLVSFFTGKGGNGLSDLIGGGEDGGDVGEGEPPHQETKEEKRQRKERERKKKQNREAKERRRQERLRGGGSTDAELERDMRNRNRRNRVTRGRRGGLMNRFKKVPKAFGKSALLKAGLLYAGGQAAGALMDNDTISTVGNVASAYSLAASVAGAAGIDIGIGALAGGAASAIGTGLSVLGTAAAAIIASPIALGALAVGAVGLAGYGIYKWYTKGKYKQVDIRFAQYGLEDVESNLGKKIFAMEQLLNKHVVINNGGASFATDTPIQQIFQALQTGEDGSPQAEIGDIYSWFNGRFKPVYLTYMSCLDTLKIKSLEEYDKLTDKRAYDIAYQASQALGNVKPFPYGVTPPIDKHDKLMGQKETAAAVGQYLAELKKYLDKSDDTTKVKDTMLSVTKPEDLAKEKEQLQEKLKNTSFLGLNGSTGYFEEKNAKNRIKEIDNEMGKLNDAYGPGKVAGTVNVKDLIPDNGIISPFVLVRMNAYGASLTLGKEYGTDLFPTWKFEALAHLERRVESLIQVIGKDVRFTGKTGELFHEFKAAFRVKDEKANDWCLWFRDRFLPVMMVYVRQYNEYGNGTPASGWQSLSATAKYQIALAIVDTRIAGPRKTLIPIWSVRTSPFETGISVAKLPEVDKLLAALQELSNKAKLRNPVLEAQQTSMKQTVNATTAHAVGGASTDKLSAGGQAQNRADVAMDPAYSFTLQNYAPVKGNSDINKVNLSGVVPSAAGVDTGVSVPRTAAEQLIIKEMMAEGITDPRAIAEMLALTNYESQGYTSTAENMRYRDPQRLMSLFKNVNDIGTAQQLVKAGPQAIANYVYGGAKGASLGNINPNDGWDFRGGGFVQLTGRANYRKFGKMIGVDLEKNPQLARTDPKVMAKIAVAFYKDNKQLQSISQNNNFGYAARGLNGGNALPGMEKRFSLYKDYLSRLAAGTLAPDGKDDGTKPATTTGGPEGAPGTPATGPVDLAAKGRAETEAAMAEGGGESPTPDKPVTPMGNAWDANKPGTDEVSIPQGSGSDAPPPMSNFGLGGKGGFDSVANTTSVAAGNRTNDYKGLNIKSSESTAGGGVHPGVVRVAQEIQARVQDFTRFTAFNDAYHHKANPRSKHAIGLALDFTVNGGVGTSESAISILRQMMTNSGMTSTEYMIINEYKVKTAAGTGGHVHFNFANDAAADKYLRTVGPANMAQMGRLSTDAAGDVAKGQSPNNAPSNIPTSSAPSPAPAPQAAAPAPAPTVPNSPMPQEQAAPASPAIDPKEMAASVKAGTGEMEELLRQMLQEMKSQRTSEPAVKNN